MYKYAIVGAISVAAHVGGGLALAADTHTTAAMSLVEEKLRAAFQQPVVIEAVTAHNDEQTAELTDEVIARLESQWYEEANSLPGELLRQVDNNELSAYIKELQAKSEGLYTEILVMGKKGLLVGQSDTASDYYQGDEAKFQQTFLAGADAVFVDEINFDESANAVQAQASFTLTDPDSGEPIGAVTVGLDPSRLVE